MGIASSSLLNLASVPVIHNATKQNSDSPTGSEGTKPVPSECPMHQELNKPTPPKCPMHNEQSSPSPENQNNSAPASPCGNKSSIPPSATTAAAVKADSYPSECPMHNSGAGMPNAPTAFSECPMNQATNENIDPANMVCVVVFFLLLFVFFSSSV